MSQPSGIVGATAVVEPFESAEIEFVAVVESLLAALELAADEDDEASADELELLAADEELSLVADELGAVAADDESLVAEEVELLVLDEALDVDELALLAEDVLLLADELGLVAADEEPLAADELSELFEELVEFPLLTLNGEVSPSKIEKSACKLYVEKLLVAIIPITKSGAMVPEAVVK